MVLSFLRRVMSLSSLGSLTLSSKRVRAEITGFLNLFCVKELNGPNGNFCGLVKGREKGADSKVVSLNLSKTLMIFDSERMREKRRESWRENLFACRNNDS
jgi:hypothetical protein